MFVACASCGKRVSDRAPVCPFCKAPPLASAPPAAGAEPPQPSSAGGAPDGLESWREAVAAADRALARDPGDARSHATRADALRRLGQRDEALAAAERAIALDPFLAPPFLTKGLALAEQARGEEALAAIAEFLKMAAPGDPLRADAERSAAALLAGEAPPPTRPRAPLPRPEPAALPDGTVAEWNDRAAALFGLRRFEEALGAAEAALRIDPESATALSNRANALFALGRNQDAIRCHERVHEVAPDFVPSWCNRGAILVRTGRRPEGLRAFLEAAELAEDAPDSPQHDEARRSIAALEREGVVPGPRDQYGFLAAGRRALAMGQGPAALELFDRAVAAAATSRACWAWKAAALRMLERHDEALACADQALERFPADAELQHARGLILARLGRSEDAVAAFESAIRADPLKPAPWIERGKALVALRRNEEASDSLARACHLAPRQPNLWLERALGEESMGRLEEAAQSYQRFLDCATPEMRAQIEQARARLAALEAQAGESPEASSTQPSTTAEDGTPGDPGQATRLALEVPEAQVPQVHAPIVLADALQRAEACLDQDQPERSLAFWDMAIAASPATPNGWAGKAEALRQLGRHAEAIGHCDRALVLRPSAAEVWQCRAACFEALQRHAEALATWEKGLALAPQQPALLYGRALALIHLQRHAEALSACDAVLALDPQHARAQFDRARATLALGRWEEAAAGFRQFLQTAPAELEALIEQARSQLATLERR